MAEFKYEDHIIKCYCTECGAYANFDYRDRTREYGYVQKSFDHEFDGVRYNRIVYELFSCTGCGRGGVAKIHCNNKVEDGKVENFYPIGIEKSDIPNNTPIDIKAELNEAELCASAGAWRAGSAMLRSVLDKILTNNGYVQNRLIDKIDQANQDGVLTESRARRAHNEIRVLGNDILHDSWKEVTEDEFLLAYHYSILILEDFYDDRATVEQILNLKGRIKN